MAGREPLDIEGCRQIYPLWIERARWAGQLCGYAIAVHGSQTYDLDLVAAPWVESATSPDVVAEVIAWAVDVWISVGPDDARVQPKPHGRRCWTMMSREPDHPHLHIDLSVMPPRPLA